MFDRVVWRDVYPGVDVAFYGRGDRLEYDLVMAPGADPSRIAGLILGSPEFQRR